MARSTTCLVLLALLVAPTFAMYDVVTRLLTLSMQGKNAPQLSLLNRELPKAVRERIVAVGLQWNAMPGLLQRAVLWDTGYVLVTEHTVAPVLTGMARSMAELQLDATAVWNATDLTDTVTQCPMYTCARTKAKFLSPSCPTSSIPDAQAIGPFISCSVDVNASDVPPMTGVYWAEDGQITPENVPTPVLRRHSADNASVPLYAIHLQDKAFDGIDACGLNGDFIIPCCARDKGFFSPATSTTVEMWLRQTAATDTMFSNTAKVMIVVLLLVLVCLAVAVLILARSQSHARARLQQQQALNSGMSTSSHGDGNNAPFITFSQCDVHPRTLTQSKTKTNSSSSQLKSLQSQHSMHGETSFLDDKQDAFATNQAITAQSAILRAFVSDKVILAKRIATSQLTMLRALSKGASGEVWLGQFESRYVAVKRLLPGRRDDVRALEQFSEEIRMASTLEHARIVQFYGITWNALSNLSIVTEYMERGDLEAFLALPAAKNLTWVKEKCTLAGDIAEALAYLHSLSPVVIHRDLKSKNIMLDRHIRAKLSDFGLTRESSTEATMTSGIGTILWSAPEVLEGTQYDEKADIFSFGIVLSEIDTCALPYGVNQDGGRSKMKSMQIVHLVSEGKLLPTFREDCPPDIVTLAKQCLHLDPAQRPSALQIVFALRSKILVKLQGEAAITE